MIAIAIMITMVIAATILVTARYRSLVKEENYLRQYHNVALAVAQAGFTDAHAWFRRQGTVAANPGGSYLLTTYTANSNPLLYPDAAFKPLWNDLPQNSDSNEIGPASFQSNPSQESWVNGNTVCAGIIRTEPISLTVSGRTTNVWGRWIVQRQLSKNWSPFGNTLSAFTDPKAVHDISASKAVNAGPGNGLVWAVTAQGFVYQYPRALSGTADAALFEGNNILNSPLKYYNGQRLLLAKATVYGELVGLTFNKVDAALWVKQICNITLSASKAKIDKGTTSSGSGYAIAANTTTGCTVANTGGVTAAAAPTMATVFPGFTLADLKNIADKTNQPGQSPNVLFPCPSANAYQQSLYDTAVSQGTFYYLDGNTTFPDRTSNPYQPTFAGSGLCFVNGNLTVASGHNGFWNGVLVVNGNVVLQDPCEIAGLLIVLNGNTITITGNTTGSYSSVFRSAEVVTNAQKFFTSYRLNKASVQYQTR